MDINFIATLNDIANKQRKNNVEKNPKEEKFEPVKPQNEELFNIKVKYKEQLIEEHEEVFKGFPLKKGIRLAKNFCKKNKLPLDDCSIVVFNSKWEYQEKIYGNLGGKKFSDNSLAEGKDFQSSSSYLKIKSKGQGRIFRGIKGC